MIPIDNTINLMFEFVTEAILDVGGDGSGYISTSDYKEFADKYGKWRISKGMEVNRYDQENRISFNLGTQDELTFMLKPATKDDYSDISILLDWTYA